MANVQRKKRQRRAKGKTLQVQNHIHCQNQKMEIGKKQEVESNMIWWCEDDGLLAGVILRTLVNDFSVEILRTVHDYILY
jgi:hypothetical protein